jgi:hypothetical protein
MEEHILIGGAYFNGKSGCFDTIVNITAIYAGPDSIDTQTPTLTGLNPGCPQGFDIQMNNNSPSFNVRCWASNVTGGSNAKTIKSGTHRLEYEQLIIYPNPTSDILNVTGDVTVNSKMLIRIFDLFGKIVFEEQLQYDGSDKLVFSLANRQIPPGYYLVRINVEGKEAVHPLILLTN